MENSTENLRIEEEDSQIPEEITYVKDSQQQSQEQHPDTEPTLHSTEKYEYFNSQNLLLLLKLANTEEYISHPKTKYLYHDLNHYFYSSDFPAHRTRVVYKYSKRQTELGTGRFYSWTQNQFYPDIEKMVGLQTLPRWVRAALASEYYWDVDIANAHPSILLSIVENLLPDHGPFPNLLYYCQRRDRVLDLASHFLGNGPMSEDEGFRKEAKRIVTSLFFGGALPTSGTIIEYKFIDGEFNFDHLIKEIEELGKLLMDLAAAQEEKTRTGDKERSQTQCTILQSLHKSFLLLKQSRSPQQQIPHLSQPQIQTQRIQSQNGHQNHQTRAQQRKEQARFLASLLQDLERKVMTEFQCVAEAKGRHVDVYIHDGCLIRKKQRVETSFSFQRKSVDWDSNTLLKAGRSKLNFETEWTEHDLIQSAEAHILARLGISVTFTVKSLDTTSFKDRLARSSFHWMIAKPPILHPPLKTEDELIYYYETHFNLCYVSQNNKWLYGSELVTFDALKHALQEKTFRGFSRNKNNPKKTEVAMSFLDTYAKRNDCRQFKNIELVKKASISSTQQQLFSSSDEPLSILSQNKNRGFGEKEQTLFLLDMNEGWPLFFNLKSRPNTGSLDQVEDFMNYLNNQLRKPKKKCELHDDGDRLFVQTLPLFPVDVDLFGDSLANYPLAIPYLNHWYLLLGENDEVFEYVIKWIAKIANDPGDMSNICGLVFYSKIQGIGKSMAIKMTMSLFAPFTKETQSLVRLFERFSDLMEFTLLLHIEDAPVDQLYKFQDELKGRLTAEKVVMEKKNYPTCRVPNFCRFMLSTNEGRSLQLSPEDRRWAAFECSSALKDNKDYFTDLARYWSLYQSKCDVMRVLLNLTTEKFDAEKQRPMTPYLSQLMNWSKRLNEISFCGQLEQLLLDNFLVGLVQYLTKTPLKKVKDFVPITEIFCSSDTHTSHKSSTVRHDGGGERSFEYYIKVSVLPDLFYIWVYGLNADASLVLWEMMRMSPANSKMQKDFKNLMALVAPHLTIQRFESKKRYSFYTLPCGAASIEKQRKSRNQITTTLCEVNLLSLYKSRRLLWVDLSENLSRCERDDGHEVVPLHQSTRTKLTHPHAIDLAEEVNMSIEDQQNDKSKKAMEFPIANDEGNMPSMNFSDMDVALWKFSEDQKENPGVMNNEGTLSLFFNSWPRNNERPPKFQ